MIISPDAFLVQPDGQYVWTPDRVWQAWKASTAALESALPHASALVLMVGLPGSGKSTWLARHAEPGRVYFDATLTHRRDRRTLIKLAGAVPVHAVWLHTPLAECLARNALREGDRRVPDAVIARMAAGLAHPPDVSEGLVSVLRIEPSPTEMV